MVTHKPIYEMPHPTALVNLRAMACLVANAVILTGAMGRALSATTVPENAGRCADIICTDRDDRAFVEINCSVW